MTHIPLIESYEPGRPIARFGDTCIDQAAWLAEVADLADTLPDCPLIHVTDNRLTFMTAFAAAGVRGAVNILPPDRQPETLARFRERFPDAKLASDDRQLAPDVLLTTPTKTSRAPADIPMPQLPAEQPAAVAFTSGSTGEPQPHTKTWGGTRHTARATGERLMPHDATAGIVATVPAQHMYGLETTLMLALLGRATITDDRPFFPADIARTLARIAAPRLLITSPVHLDALVRSGERLGTLETIVSATAPLPKALAQAAEQQFEAPVFEIYGCTEGGSLATRRTTQTDRWTLLEGFSMAESGPSRVPSFRLR